MKFMKNELIALSIFCSVLLIVFSFKFDESTKKYEEYGGEKDKIIVYLFNSLYRKDIMFKYDNINDFLIRNESFDEVCFFLNDYKVPGEKSIDPELISETRKINSNVVILFKENKQKLAFTASNTNYLMAAGNRCVKLK